MHVLDSVALQLEDDLLLVTVFDFLLEDVEDLALDVLGDLLLPVASLLKAIVELRVVTTEENHQLEPSLGEEVTRVELKYNASSAAHKRLELIADHVDVKFGDIKLLIPALVQLLRLNEISELHVLEPLDLVLFLQLVLQEGAQ